MMVGKVKVLQYCDTLKTNDVDHLMNAIENSRLVKDDHYDMLNGCPQNYGLDDVTGLCEETDVGQVWEDQKKQCLNCWTMALKTGGEVVERIHDKPVE